MEHIYNSCHDDITKDYIMSVFMDESVTMGECEESLQPYFEAEEMADILCERVSFIRSDEELQQIQRARAQVDILDMVGMMALNSEGHDHNHRRNHNHNPCDPDIKQFIVGKYDLQALRDRPCIPFLPSELGAKGAKDKKKQDVRYRDNMVATSKGEKYLIVDKAT